MRIVEDEADDCLFELGEIAVFTSSMRQETYISTIAQVHIDSWSTGLCPEIRKATDQEKKAWYDADCHSLVIASWHCGYGGPDWEIKLYLG